MWMFAQAATHTDVFFPPCCAPAHLSRGCIGPEGAEALLAGVAKAPALVHGGDHQVLRAAPRGQQHGGEVAVLAVTIPVWVGKGWRGRG